MCQEERFHRYILRFLLISFVGHVLNKATDLRQAPDLNSSGNMAVLKPVPNFFQISVLLGLPLSELVGGSSSAIQHNPQGTSHM